MTLSHNFVTRIRVPLHNPSWMLRFLNSIIILLTLRFNSCGGKSGGLSEFRNSGGYCSPPVLASLTESKLVYLLKSPGNLKRRYKFLTKIH